MKPSQKCFDLIKKFEGLRLTAYKCSAGKWTVGYGNTFYPNGSRVQPVDRITMQQANDMLEWAVTTKAKALPQITVNQNQFDAICSFVYNIGVGAFNQSTMLRKIRLNPDDETIRDEFMRWVRAGGKVLKGLQNRRKAEADLYFSNL